MTIWEFTCQCGTKKKHYGKVDSSVDKDHACDNCGKILLSVRDNCIHLQCNVGTTGAKPGERLFEYNGDPSMLYSDIDQYKPKSISKYELREEFLDHIRSLVDYWDKEERRPKARDKLSGMAFSILSFIDGCCHMPSMDIVMRPYESDKQYRIDNGEDWVEPGTVINDDCMLHELFYEKDED